MADNADIKRSICPNICKQCRPQCKMWREISNLEGPKLMKNIPQEEASRGAGSPQKIEMARAARSSGVSPSLPKITCCGTCDIILEQISKLLSEIWDLLGPEQKVSEPCVLGRSRSCQCQQCIRHSRQGYSQDFGPSSPKERYVSWLTRLKPILLSVLEGVKRGRHQIYVGEPKDELENILEQLRIPLRKQARNIRISSLTNIPLSSTERDAGLVTSLIENTALLEKVLARIKNESDLIEMKLRQEKIKAFEMHDRTDHLPELQTTHYYDSAGNLRTAYLPEQKSTHYYDEAGNLRTADVLEHKPTHYYDKAGNLSTAYLPEHRPTHYYDEAGNLRIAYLPEHRPTHYYDAAGNLRPAHRPDPEHKPTHYYDAAGNLRTAHLPEHKPTHYYDAAGNLTTAHLPEYKPTHYYDAAGNLRTAHLPEHKPTHYYDAAGNLRPAHPLEHKPTHYYDATGNLKPAHPLEHKPTHYYDAAGNLRTAHLPEHKPTHYYDAAGNLRPAHPLEHKPTHYYDATGNLKPAHPLEHKPTHYYDAAGNLRPAHPPEHKPTHYYDAAGNLKTTHPPEHKPTHYYDAAGNLRPAHRPDPEHKPTHYYDAAGNLRPAHLPEHKPTHYYDAAGNLRPAHRPDPESKPTDYYDAAGNLRPAHPPEHKPTHYYDAAGNLRPAHSPEHKPTHYYDAAGNLRSVISQKKLAQKARSASTVSETSDYVMFPPISGRTKSGRKEDRSGGATYTKEDRRKQPTDRIHYTKEDEMKLKRDATFTKEETSYKRDHSQHLAKTGYADKDRRSRAVERYDKRLPKTIGSRSPPEKRDKSPKLFTSPPGILKEKTTKGIIQHARMERTGKRTVEVKQKVQKTSPKGDIKYRGRWPKEPLPSRGDLIKKSADREKGQKGTREMKGHVRTGSEKDLARTGGKKDHVRTGSDKGDARTVSEKDHTRPGRKKDHVRTGSDEGHARIESDKDRVRTESEKDHEGKGSEKVRSRTGSEKDHVKSGGKKDHLRTGSEKDHSRTGSEKAHLKTGGKKEQADATTGSEKDHVKSGEKPDHVRTGSEKGNLKTGGKRERGDARTGSEKDHTRTDSKKDHVRTGSDKDHESTDDGKDRVKTGDKRERGDARTGSEKDHTRPVSKKDHVRTGSDKDRVRKGSERDQARTGSDKDHEKTDDGKDSVKTGGKRERGDARTRSEKDHTRPVSIKDHVRTGSDKDRVKIGSERDQARTGSDKDHEKTDDGKDRVKTGGEKDREKTGGKKGRSRTGSEKAQEEGSETSLTKQKDISSKPGKLYYKGKPVTMKDEAQRGGLKVKVLKGAIETKIEKVVRHPEISGDGTLREVPKTELTSRMKKQASKKDPDVKRKKTIVSEVPSNVILKRMNAQMMQELRLARKEVTMQRALPRKLKSIKSLPNVHMLLKKKKKKIKVTDSETGITICTGLEESPEMIQGDIVVPLESMEKLEHIRVKPLLFKVEADFQDDEPLSALLPSIPAVEATSKMEDKHKSKTLLTKQKQKIEKPLLDNKGVIMYKLSNPQFIDMGYTKLPAVNVKRKSFIYKMVQPNPEEDWFRRHVRHRVLYYDTCEILAEIDDDGYGCWYYKNGRVALKYYAAEEKYAENRYVIFSSGEKDENGNPRCVTVLATFDHVGNGIVYDHCGNIRLKYNQNEGENFDTTIGATGRWKWHSMTTTLSSLQNVYVEEHMKLASQSTLNVIQEIAKEGVSSDVPVHHQYDKKEHIHMLTTEMGNFMREKKKLLLQKYKTFELKLKAFKLNEEFSLRIYEQTKIWLYFNVGSRNLKLNLGLRLLSSDILGTEMVNLNEIYTPFDRVIPESESISNILDIIRETKKQERKKKCGFKKYFSDCKNTSSRLGVVN